MRANDNWSMESIGATIRKLRKNKGLSYGQLAYKSGVSRTYLHSIEHGKVLPPKNEYIEKIAQALDVEPEYFLEYRMRQFQKLYESDPERGDTLYAFLKNPERYKELVGNKRR